MNFHSSTFRLWCGLWILILEIILKERTEFEWKEYIDQNTHKKNYTDPYDNRPQRSLREKGSCRLGRENKEIARSIGGGSSHSNLLPCGAWERHEDRGEISRNLVVALRRSPELPLGWPRLPWGWRAYYCWSWFQLFRLGCAALHLVTAVELGPGGVNQC